MTALKEALHRQWHKLWGPSAVTAVLQITKTVIAATLAWWLAAIAFDFQLQFLAPWLALLTVQSTVQRSLVRGAEMLVASMTGLFIALAVAYLWGVSLWSFALTLAIGLVISYLPPLRHEGVAVATTGIFILASGRADELSMLGDRIIEVCLGVTVGVLMNAIVIPPLRERQTVRYLEHLRYRIGKFLVGMSADCEETVDSEQAQEWVSEVESIKSEADDAWRTVRFTREAARLNPRMIRRRRNGPSEANHEENLARVGRAIAELLHLVRTVADSHSGEDTWDSHFRTSWIAIVRDTGQALCEHRTGVENLLDRLDLLSRELSTTELPEHLWPLYGSLLASTRHLLSIVHGATIGFARDETT